LQPNIPEDLTVSRLLPTAPYRGTRDFLPDETSIRQQVFHRLYDTIELYGYRRYDGPLLESVEIYEAKSGREIAELQLYTLTDRGGRRLALRPEMTPSVARMIAANANTLKFPVRWYSHPNCHRYERPQRGRAREHWQINVDIFGSDSWRCEIEMFELIHDMMGAVGAAPDMYVLRVSDRILLEGVLTTIVGVAPQQVRDVSSLIDRWEKTAREDLLTEANQIGVSEAQFNTLEATLKAGADIINDLPAEAVQRSPLIPVLRSSARDLVTFDLMIVRAFEYYTSTVFEVFDRHPTNNRSLFGGGRYGDLVGLFSDQKIPGIGFGFGDVTLFNFLDVHGLTPPVQSQLDAVVIPLDDQLLDPARDIARQLRGCGWRTNTPFEQRKLGKELVRADNTGARVAVIVGPDDWRDCVLVVRNLTTRDQQRVERAAVAKVVRQELSRHA